MATQERKHVAGMMTCKCGTQAARKRSVRGYRYFCETCGLKTLVWSSIDVAKSNWNNLVKCQREDDEARPKPGTLHEAFAEV